MNYSVFQRMVMVCSMAFGEMGLKERIKTVLNYRKPTFWLIAVAIVACAAVAMCFLKNPIKKISDKELKNEAWPLSQTCAFVSEVAIDKGNTEIAHAKDGKVIEVIYPLEGS